MKITNKITNKVMKAATDAAAKVAVSNVNSACTFMLHQPKVQHFQKDSKNNFFSYLKI